VPPPVATGHNNADTHTHDTFCGAASGRATASSRSSMPRAKGEMHSQAPKPPKQTHAPLATTSDRLVEGVVDVRHKDAGTPIQRVRLRHLGAWRREDARRGREAGPGPCRAERWYYYHGVMCTWELEQVHTIHKNGPHRATNCTCQRPLTTRGASLSAPLSADQPVP
jgi:hypothetical protein